MKRFRLQMLALFLACLCVTSPAVALCLTDNTCVQSLADTLRSDGYLKGLEAYRAGNYSDAVKFWKKAAKEGEALAQCNLGASYAAGKGVRQDYSKALKWFRKAA